MTTNPRIVAVFTDYDRDYRGRPMALVIWRNRDYEYVLHDDCAEYGIAV